MAFWPLGMDGCDIEFWGSAYHFVRSNRQLTDPDQKKQSRLSKLLSICWIPIWKADFWNAMHIHSDFLIISSPAEGKVRSLGGTCSSSRMRASSVVKFALVLMVRSVWQISEIVNMKLLHGVKQKFDKIWINCANPTRPKIWVLCKNLIFLEKTFFFDWTYNF